MKVRNKEKIVTKRKEQPSLEESGNLRAFKEAIMEVDWEGICLAGMSCLGRTFTIISKEKN